MVTAASAVDAPPVHVAVPPTPDSVATVGDLRVTFRRNGSDVAALRGVSLDIVPGEILGLVGESGSGKSVLGFTLLGLLPKHAKIDGTVRVTGADMVTGDAKALRKVRRLDLGAVFQDPMTSLNPTMRIGQPGRRGRGQRRGGAAPAHRRRHPRSQAPDARLPARTLRRAAATRDDRDGDRRRPGTDHRRRTDHGARRHRAGPGAAPAAAPARRDRLQHRADHPRPRGRRADLGPHRRAVRRPHRRDRSDRRGPRRARPPVHPRAAALPADAGHRARPQARRARRFGAQCDDAAAGMRVRSALRARHRRLQRRRHRTPSTVAPGRVSACIRPLDDVAAAARNRVDKHRRTVRSPPDPTATTSRRRWCART